MIGVVVLKEKKALNATVLINNKVFSDSYLIESCITYECTQGIRAGVSTTSGGLISIKFNQIEKENDKIIKIICVIYCTI
jgi:hypothetical protein